jgi:hypothetical protein
LRVLCVVLLLVPKVVFGIGRDGHVIP